MSWVARSGATALLADYTHYAGRKLPLLLALMLAAALAEGFGILMLVPLVAIAIGGAPVPDRLGELADFADRLSTGQRFLCALALFIAAMAARSLLIYARDIRLARLQAGYEASLKLRAAATLAQRGWSFAARVGQAGMQSLLLNDVPRAVTGSAEAQQCAVSLIFLAVQFGLTAILSFKLAAAAATVLFVSFLLSAGWARRGVRSGMALAAKYEHSSSAGFRLHSGLKAALAQGTSSQFLDEYASSLARAKMELEEFFRDRSTAQGFASFGSALVAALLLFAGYRIFGLPFPVLATLLVLFARMAGPAQQLQRSLQGLAAYAPFFASIELRLGALASSHVKTQTAEPIDWHELKLTKVGFEHQPGLGIRDISLRLAKGEWLAVTGPSGAGKTTLADVAAGLLPPQSGEVTLDGRMLGGEPLQQWRASLAYLGQEGSLFDDSVRANLLADGAIADDQTLWSALKTVGLSERVRAFSAGLDESVGDRGSQLSGGERQRLAFARALLRHPSLCILDEATAALDENSETRLLAHLQAIEPRPAAIVVAHRASTLAHCDSTLAIQHGKVQLRSGTSEEEFRL